MLGNVWVCFHAALHYIFVCITVRWARVEGSGFLLRDLLDFAVQLAGGGLVEFYAVGQTARLYGVQETEGTYAIHVSGVLSQIKRDLKEREREKEMEDLLKDLCRTSFLPKEPFGT